MLDARYFTTTTAMTTSEAKIDWKTITFTPEEEADIKAEFSQVGGGVLFGLFVFSGVTAF